MNCFGDSPAFPLGQSRYGDRMKPIAILALAMIVTACKPADNEPGPGGVTVGEAAMLDEAADMVEAKRLPRAGPEDSPEESVESEGTDTAQDR